MFKGLGNLASMMGNMHQLPDKFREINEQLRAETISVSAGEGAVQVNVNGLGEMLSIQLPSENTDAEQVQQWILQACNDASSQAKQRFADAVQQMAADLNLNIPGFDGLVKNLTGGGS